MQRRKFLVLGGTLPLPLISGCSGSDDEASANPDKTPTDTPTTNDSERDNQESPNEESPKDQPLARFTRENLDSFEEYPDYSDSPTSEIIRLIPYEKVDSQEVSLYLEPSKESLTKDDTITFTLLNNLDEPFEGSFYHWELHKQVNDTWFNVKLSPSIDVLQTLNPGESHRWTLDPNHERAEDFDSIETFQTGDLQTALGQMLETLVVPGLGGGRYAFGITGWRRSESSDGKTAVVATFDLDAKPIDLTPTEALQEVQTEGDSVTATTEPSGPDAELDPPKTYQVDRLQDSPSDATPLITEQLWRNPPFWDTFALLQEHDVDRAILTERDQHRYNGIFSILVGDRNEEGIYEYNGEFYDVTRSTPEQSQS